MLHPLWKKAVKYWLSSISQILRGNPVPDFYRNMSRTEKSKIWKLAFCGPWKLLYLVGKTVKLWVAFKIVNPLAFLVYFWKNRKKLHGRCFFCCFVVFSEFFFPAFASEISFFNMRPFYSFLFRYFEITARSKLCFKYCCLKECQTFLLKNIFEFKYCCFPPPFFDKYFRNIWIDALKCKGFRSMAICTIGTLPVHFLYRNPVQLFLSEQILVCLLFRMELKLVCLFFLRPAR